MTRSLVSSLLMLLTFSVQAQLVINEVMVRNGTSLFDEDGDTPDWVELYNAGVNVEALADHTLSQNANELDDWEIDWSGNVQPGEFVVIFCSGKDRNDQQELHASFKLSDGEQLYLSKNNQLIDQHLMPDLGSDVSMGRMPDGAGTWGLAYLGTPAISNNSATPYSYPDVSVDPGIYDEAFGLDLIAAPGHQIRYTLDCEIPDQNSLLFSDQIILEDVTEQPERFARIPTNPPGIEEQYMWEEPGSMVAKGTVVRYRTYYNGVPSSPVRTASYFVFPEGDHRYSLPILSVVSDSLSFFDHDSGIYVPGIVHDLNPEFNSPWGTGNYHQTGPDWERISHIELFGEGGELEMAIPVGMRIHGQGSRALPQKSLRFYTRGKYGSSSFQHPVFGTNSIDGREVMVLRNMGQDFVKGVSTDVFSHEMARSMGQEYLPYKAVTVFLNGEYWGIQNLRERFDEQNLAQYHELPEHEIDLIDSYYGGWTAGTNDAYWELYNFIDDNDLSIEFNYQMVDSKMDIANFIDHTLIKIFLGCYDWPGNNVKMWRPRQSGSKFRWLLVDSDGCLSDTEFNSLEHATEPNNPGWPNPYQSTLFLRKLLENDDFKEMFLQRFDSLLLTEFAPDDLSEILVSLRDEYQVGYLEHQIRWHGLENYSEFHWNYFKAFDFIRLRPCVLREQFNTYFNLSENYFQYQCDSSYHVGMGDRAWETAVYPNPNNGNFRINQGQNSGRCDLTIFNIEGQEVFRSRDLAQNGVISVSSGLRAGIYVMELRANDQLARHKIIVTGGY